MKLKFDDVVILSDIEVLEGIRCCFRNANDLYKSSQILKDNRKYGLATTILILSVEELIKGFGLFNTLIVNDKNLMREFFESRNLHKSRHYFALYLTEFFKIVNFQEILKSDKDINNVSILEIVKQINFQKLIKNIEKQETYIENWFLSANEKKNNGLYVSYCNNSFFTPQQIEQKEFTRALRETNRIRKYFSMILLLFAFTKDEEIIGFLDIMRQIDFSNIE